MSKLLLNVGEASCSLMGRIKRKVLFGTTNQAKIKHVMALAVDWPVTIVSPSCLGLDLHILEDAPTVEANASKKALAYAIAADLPAFALDAGLFIEQFPLEKQPGVFVRRIQQEHVHVSDEELLGHYIAELQAIGGTSTGHWQIAVALASPTQQVLVESYTVQTRFVAQPSPVRIPDAPLSSLMLDPPTNRYYSEIGYSERPDSAFLRQALEKLFHYF